LTMARLNIKIGSAPKNVSSGGGKYIKGMIAGSHLAIAVPW